MIKRLVIQNFKSLVAFECDFASFNIVVGANNSGKTSILQAMHLLTSLVQAHQLHTGGRADRFVLGAQQLLYSPMLQLSAILPLGAPASTTTTVAVDLRGGDDSVKTVSAAVQFRPDGSVEVVLTNAAALEPLRDLSNPYAIHLAGFMGLAQVEGSIGFGALRRAVARGHANVSLRNTLRELSENRIGWHSFQQAVNDVFSGVELRVNFDPLTDEHVAVTLMHGASELPLDAVGTGTLQAIQILAYLHLFKPRVLLLDEPDSHLHPDNQRRMIRALWRESERGYTQVIATTHSRHVLDAKPELAKLLVVSNGTLVKGAEERPIALLMELGAIDDTERLVSGAVKCVIATEDTDTEEVEHVFYSSGFVKSETLVCSYAGCSKVDSAIVLATFVRRYAPGVVLVIHRDRDYLPDAEIERFSVELGRQGIEVFITRGNDIESHYLNANHLVAAYPVLSLQQAQEALDRAIEQSQEESYKALVRARSDFASRERNKRENRGKQPDQGEIASACRKELDGAPRQLAFGKHTLGLLKQELQRTLRVHPIVNVDSPHLADAELIGIASKIWEKKTK